MMNEPTPQETRVQPKSRQSALILLGSGFSKLLSMVAMLAIAWRMGIEAVGILAAAYAFVGLFQFLFDGGLSTTHIKKLSEGSDRDTCIGAFVWLKVLATLAGAATVAAMIPLRQLITGGRATPLELQVILFILVARSMNSLIEIPRATFTATGQIAKRQTLLAVQAVSDFTFVMAVVLLSGDLLLLAATHVASEVVAGAVAIRLFRGHRIKRPSAEILKQYARFSMPLIGALVMVSIHTSVDKLMIREFMSVAAVGYYHVAARCFAFVLLLPSAVSTILMPSASRCLANNKPEESARIMLKAERYLALIVAPISAGMAVFAPRIMAVFGEEFIQGAPVLAVFGAVCFVFSVNRPSATMIVSLGKPGTVLRMTAVLIVANVVLNCFLIPGRFLGIGAAGLGATGAALATLIVGVAGMAITKTVVKKHTGAGMAPCVAVYPVVAVAAGLAAVYGTSRVMPASAPPVLVAGAGGVLLLIVYGAILFAVRELAWADLRYLWGSLNPSRLAADIRNDLSGPRKAAKPLPSTGPAGVGDEATA